MTLITVAGKEENGKQTCLVMLRHLFYSSIGKEQRGHGRSGRKTSFKHST